MAITIAGPPIRPPRTFRRKDRPLTTSWHIWIAPVLGLAEILLLGAVVYLTIIQFTRSRASSYIERFNSGDALESRAAVDGWLQEHSTSKARLEALARDPVLNTHLRRFANLFQELGAAYQFRVAHRKTVRTLFDALVIMYWEALQFWVRDYRARADPSLYARFEYLYTEFKARARGGGERAEYVFAYGSLMDPASLTAGLGRDVAIGELIPVTLLGWARRWSIGEAVRLGTSVDPTAAAFLDIERDPGSSVTGIMIRVTPRELERLTVREKNYAVRDLRDAVRLAGNREPAPGAKVWCFIGRPRHRVAATTHAAVVLESYLQRVIDAARRIDPAIEAELHASVAASGFELATGSYVFVDERQAALV